jgi:hypothetical protein
LSPGSAPRRTRAAKALSMPKTRSIGNSVLTVRWCYRETTRTNCAPRPLGNWQALNEIPAMPCSSPPWKMAFTPAFS